ncbi:hypothetical protein Hesp01_50760 [Herbidospora sp. NBRC 101105]|nr:hypothetical protein Hesp01_50760 [Herbidospora sp. NBRC 101105]
MSEKPEFCGVLAALKQRTSACCAPAPGAHMDTLHRAGARSFTAVTCRLPAGAAEPSPGSVTLYQPTPSTATMLPAPAELYWVTMPEL